MADNFDALLKMLAIAVPFLAVFALAIYAVRYRPKPPKMAELAPRLASPEEVAELEELHALAVRDFGSKHPAALRWEEKLRVAKGI